MNSKGCKLNSWAFRYGARCSGLELLRKETRNPVNTPDIWINWFLISTNYVSLTGTAAATASTVGTLKAIRILNGTGTAISSQTGTLTRFVSLSGTGNAVSGSSASLRSTRSLQGIGVAVSGGAGTLSASHVSFIPLAGGAIAQTTALGGLKAFTRCAGICAALAAATSPNQLRRFRSAAGTGGSVTGNSGTATMFRSLQGVVSGASIATGSLVILTYKYLAGVAVASAGALGSLRIMVFEYLSGTCAALTGRGEIITLSGISDLPGGAASGSLKIIRRIWGPASIALGHATTNLRFMKNLSGQCSAAGSSTSVRMRRHLRLK